MSHLVNQWCTIFLFSVLYKIPVFSVVQNSCFQWCTIFLYEMLYLSLFCLNLSYKSLDVYNSGGAVVPNSDVYKYSHPCKLVLFAGCPFHVSSMSLSLKPWLQHSWDLGRKRGLFWPLLGKQGVGKHFIERGGMASEGGRDGGTVERFPSPNE